MSFFRAVIYLLIRSKIYQYIAYQRTAGNQLKKISASATVLLTLKVEVQSPYNRITISYNRKGHRAFAVFLLSIFVGKCRRAVSDMRCRSPPLHLDFLHFKNSDGRYLWWNMHQERYISEKVAAMWNYPTRSSAVAGNPTRPWSTGGSNGTDGQPFSPPAL